MNIEDTKKAIAVMQAFVEGKKVQSLSKEYGTVTCNNLTYPSWSWAEYDYEIVKTPHSINWSEVSDEYNYLWCSYVGELLLSKEKPKIEFTSKNIGCLTSDSSLPTYMFKSAKKGDDPMQIVVRSGYKEKE